jgi:hypothetical protein
MKTIIMQSSPYLYLLHHSSWKFCVYLDMDFATVVPEYNFLYAVHVLLLLVGRNQSQEFFIPQIFCKVNMIAGIYSSPAVIWFFSHLVVVFTGKY